MMAALVHMRTTTESRMTRITISREQSRELDRRAVEEYGMASVVLMENAGRGVADTLCRLGIDGPVSICCGAGNNGGDGFVVARHLDLRGHAVYVLLLADAGKLSGDALLNYRVLEKSGIPIVAVDGKRLTGELAKSAWIVDAILGTGARGEPRPPLDAAIDAINAQGKSVLAIDIPSGLDCETGEAANHTVEATHTCTFVAAKPGFLNPAAARHLGEVHVLDIGAPRKLVEESLALAGECAD
jgi:NAD(P)H-hydrate epimerase